MNYFVYILTNINNTVLYTGITNNLPRRAAEHKSKIIDGFTKKYNLVKLVFYENFPSPQEAISAEKKIKGWLRKRKIDLIKSKNPEFKDLSSEIDPSLRSG